MQVLPGEKLAQAIAGLLFAVHPIHSEAVAGIVGRADLLSCLLAQGAFLSYVAHRERNGRGVHLLLSVLLSLLATLAKETGISALALCLLWDFSRSELGLGRTSSSTILAGSLAILTLGRLRIGGGRSPEFASADNPVARHPSRLARGLTFLYLPAASLGMLLCPCTLSFDWSMNAVPLLASLGDPRNLQSLLLYGTLATLVVWALKALNKHDNHQTDQVPMIHYTLPRCPVCAGRRTAGCHTDNCRYANNNNGPVAECHCLKKKPSTPKGLPVPSSLLTILGFLVLPFLPASNLFFYVGFVIAERIMYLPSIGACLGVAAAISASYKLARRKTATKTARAILAITGILLCCMAAKTMRRNVDWYNEENLYRSALSINPPKGEFYCERIYIYIFF